MESPVFGYLVVATFGLLVLVSGGIVYLTFAEWRDRRRRDQAEKADRANRPRKVR